MGYGSTSAAQFQFTPLREGRPRWRFRPRWARTNFNSRPSARGDVVLQAHFRVAVRFQFTPLREGRLSEGWYVVGIIGFQFTPLREGRLFLGLLTCLICYFNSRPSARGDGRLGADEALMV